MECDIPGQEYRGAGEGEIPAWDFALFRRGMLTIAAGEGK